jgi:methylmalonyl-CoA mutase N-terminal domain/subunit
VRIALRTQQILANEVGCTDSADPFGGSYFIESLTTELESRATELIERIEALGGAVAAIEQGFVQAEIEEASYRHQREVESGERVIVGVNRFQEEADAEAVDLHRIDPQIELRQRERTAKVRSERDGTSVEKALEAVRNTARGSENLLPAMREALALRATIGEVCTVLREEFGTFDRA